MNEVFGEENFVDCIIWKKRYGGGAKEKFLVTLHEYVLFYAKNIDFLETIFVPYSDEAIERYYTQQDDNYDVRGPYRTHPLEATKSMGERKNLVFPIPAPDGTEVWPKRQWLWSKERTMAALDYGELEFLRSQDGGWSVHTKQYLKDKKGRTRSTKAFSIIDNVYSQHGTNELLELFGDARIFPFPKPTGLIKRLLEIATEPDEDAIIADFFAGSGSTAHAIMELNSEDDGNRRYILCQLPEETPEGSSARETGYEFISQITQERIRRVADKIKAEQKDKLDLSDPDSVDDYGFKVFKLHSSNFRAWSKSEYSSVSEVQDQLDMFETPLVDQWQEDDLLVEVMLLQGFPLESLVITLEGFTKNTVQMVESDFHAHRLFVCLDRTVEQVTIDQLDLNAEDIFVCLDSALTDTAKMRLADVCNLRVI